VSACAVSSEDTSQSCPREFKADSAEELEKLSPGDEKDEKEEMGVGRKLRVRKT
jgi:hypothetical protein